MARHVIGFFCGTGYTTTTDKSYQLIGASVAKHSTVFGYDGCQVLGGGLFAYGVEEQADAFVADLKQKVFGNKINAHMIAHSRGCFSALLAIQKIQQDPELKDKVNFSLDLRDPVPGNFQLTTKVTGNWVLANQMRDLSACERIKKVSVTLQEKALFPLAFDALLPKFHPDTQVEVEVLPGFHDVQQRVDHDRRAETDQLFVLGHLKALSLLQENGHRLATALDQTALLQQQVQAYDAMVPWVKGRVEEFTERDLHFSGKTLFNRAAKQEIEVINWRHAQLKQLVPTHVLCGMVQHDYNRRKTDFDHYCNLMMSLDTYSASHSQHQNLIDKIRILAKNYLDGSISVVRFADECDKQLKLASVTSKALNQSINLLCLNGYFAKLTSVMKQHVPAKNILRDQLNTLLLALYQEISFDIDNGASIRHIAQSRVHPLIHDTAFFIEGLYEDPLNTERAVSAAEVYIRDHVKLARNWHLGFKIIAGLTLCVAAAALCCAFGVAIGACAGIALGMYLGIPVMESVFLAVLGAFCYTPAVGIAGLVTGIASSIHFFAPSKLEQQVQELGRIVKQQATADSLATETQEPVVFSDESDNENDRDYIPVY